MKYLNFKNLLAVAILGLGTVITSCDKTNPDDDGDIIYGDFQLAFASGTESLSGTYLQGVEDLSTGEITFAGRGHELSSARTARIFTSSDGATVYSLNYTVGTIEKLSYNGGQNYTRIGNPFDASVLLGSATVRFTKLNDDEASVHVTSATAQYESETEYIGHKITASIGILDLKNMNFGSNYNANINVVLPDDLKRQGYYISRIDCPVKSGNKLYYGAAVSIFNPSTGRNTETDKTFTLVVDYPSLENATVIQTSLVKGSTNGYRTPTQHVNEAGEILQMVSNNGETSIIKIVNGQYHSTFKYNLHTLLGRQTSSNGWFYVGNGIGYIPYEKVGDDQVQIGVNPQGEPSYSSAWGLARMDLNNNTVVDLNTPDGLWLQQYQTSVVRDGKFYIALSPVGTQGYIYIFDVNSTNPEGTKGARIFSGADQYYIGIY
jgi:hypothetical protein